jgi:hypothetical protein
MNKKSPETLCHIELHKNLPHSLILFQMSEKLNFAEFGLNN